MTARTWPVVTCTACGTTGPGRARVGLCKRCYARTRHPVQPCPGCGRARRHLAAGLCARCYRLSRIRIVTCPGCGQERPVHFGDRCERCKRRAAARAGACGDCGKQVARLWSGRCRSCDTKSREVTGACRDCGDLTKLEYGLCRACRLFRWAHPAGVCPWCGRQQPIGAAGACRSCQLAARTARALGKRARALRPRVVLPPAVPTRQTTGACADCGDLTHLSGGRCSACRAFRRAHPVGTCPWCGRQQPVGAAGACRSCQLAARTAQALRKQAPAAWPRPEPAAAVAPPLAVLASYGQARGWRPGTLGQACRAVTAVLASRGELGQPPWDADVLRGFLNARRLPARRAIEFLTSQGLARPSPHTVFGRWLAARLAALPAPVAAEVRTWAEALQGHGPRAGRPRQDRTIQGYLRALQAPLAGWAAQYESLRQVTTDDLAAALTPLTGADRLLALAAMRSLFGTLKAHRVLFTNPAAALTGHRIQPPPVLPLDDGLRARLLGTVHDPAERLIVLLAGVHALRPSDICALVLDDVGPATGTLLTGGRTRPLDHLTAGQLRAWLQARHARWPVTANPHLLINRSTTDGLDPVHRSYVQATVRQLGITAHQLRADRLLAEAQASGGDPLQLTHLFGISDPTAIRYCAELGPPGVPPDDPNDQARRTWQHVGDAGRPDRPPATR
jgi:integrase